MLTAAALLLSSWMAPKEVTLEPTDDVWVYQFAENQDSDPFLRVWSTGGQAVGESFEGHLPFSYSCLKFDVSKLEGTVVKGAKLILVHSGGAGYSESDSKAAPLEARSLPGGWKETSWQYDQAMKIHPPKEAGSIFGSGVGKPGSSEEEFKIEIDLMAGPANFAKAYEEAVKSEAKAVSVGLTSRLSPEDGENFVYKMFSRNNDEAKRPKLVLMLE